MHFFFKLPAKKRKLRTGRRVSITISMSDNEESNANKRRKMLHDRPSKTSKSKGIDVFKLSVL